MKTLTLLNYIEFVAILVFETILYHYSPDMQVICSIILSALCVLYIVALCILNSITHNESKLKSSVTWIYIVGVLLCCWTPVALNAIQH